MLLTNNSLDNPPYKAPYANLFMDPETNACLYIEVWRGGGWDRLGPYTTQLRARVVKRYDRVTIGNPDKGYSDFVVNGRRV